MVFRITPILPANLDIKGIKKSILNATKDEGKDLVKDYEKTTATWEGDKPDFDFIGSFTGTKAFVKVGPRGNKEGVKKWSILNAGSPPHSIEAVRADRLAFQAEGFKAKTTPGKLQSGRGSPASGPIIYTPSVQHPGIEARGWSKTILRLNKRRFPKRVSKAIRNVRKFR